MKPELIKETVVELEKTKADRWSEYMALNETIKNLQNLCEHDWVYEGHGHKDDHYTCSICGKNEKR